jgi:hypothetical protein
MAATAAFLRWAPPGWLIGSLPLRHKFGQLANDRFISCPDCLQWIGPLRAMLPSSKLPAARAFFAWFALAAPSLLK